MDDLEAGAPRGRRRWLYVAVISVVLVAAAAGVWLLLRDDGRRPTPAAIEAVFAREHARCVQLTGNNAPDTREDLLNLEAGLVAQAKAGGLGEGRVVGLLRAEGDRIRALPPGSVISSYRCDDRPDLDPADVAPGSVQGEFGTYTHDGEERVYTVTVAADSPLRHDLEASGADVVIRAEP